MEGAKNESLSSLLMPYQSSPDDNRKPAPTSSHLHVENVGEYKWRWVKAANKAGLPLAEWVKRSLNAAAEAEERKGTE